MHKHSGFSHHHNIKGRNLFIAVLLNVLITVLQTVGGILSGSLALLSDALHNFSDVLALVVAYIANRLSSHPHTKDKTFGYKRSEVMAAFFNSSILIGVAFFLIAEAVKKLIYPEAVDSLWVIILGALSVALNIISVLFIKKDAHENMNIKAAYLHLLTDAMSSTVVMVGGIFMYYYHIFWIDPIASMLIAGYLIAASMKLIKDTIWILMDFAPVDIDMDRVVDMVETFDEIDNIHHIHIWKIDEHTVMLEAHLDLSKNITVQESGELVDKLEKMLFEQFNISHCTFQCEHSRSDKKDIVV